MGAGDVSCLGGVREIGRNHARRFSQSRVDSCSRDPVGSLAV